MHIIDGIAYAGEPAALMEVARVEPLDDLRMLVTFSTGETRLFDASILLDGPVFAPLREKAVFDGAYVDSGVCTWQDGAIDVAPEFMYENSLPCETIACP